jgi:hypothetical protein
LAVTGDFDTNHSNNQPPMEEIKLSEVVAGADLRQCRPQLGKALTFLIKNRRAIKTRQVIKGIALASTDGNPTKVAR